MVGNDIVQKLVSTWLGKIVVGTVAVLTILRYGGGLYAFIETEKLERPTYEVLRKLKGGVEIRRYQPYLIAETTTDVSGFQEAGRKGFGPCAAYIFGKNQKSSGSNRLLPAWVSAVMGRGTSPSNCEKMAMTAPVRLEGVGGDSETNNKKKKLQPTRVSFVIGSNYTVQTAPVPLESDKIKIRQVPTHTVAAKTFSGPPPTDERVRKERQKLLATLEDADIDLPTATAVTPTSSTKKSHRTSNNSNEETLVYGYHDPFITPNFLRRNEVAIVLEGRI
jgi:SOUL heme-binding protein